MATECIAYAPLLVPSVSANEGWDGGAVSVDYLTGDGYFGWSVPSGTVAATVGFSTTTTATPQLTDVQFGFMFQRGTAFVSESGARVGSSFSYTSSDTFFVSRADNTIFYSVRRTGGVDFTPVDIRGQVYWIPGEVLYERTAIAAPLYLRALLFTQYDSITNETMGTLSESAAAGAAVYGEFTLQGFASELATAPTMAYGTLSLTGFGSLASDTGTYGQLQLTGQASADVSGAVVYGELAFSGELGSNDFYVDVAGVAGAFSLIGATNSTNTTTIVDGSFPAFIGAAGDTLADGVYGELPPIDGYSATTPFRTNYIRGIIGWSYTLQLIDVAEDVVEVFTAGDATTVTELLPPFDVVETFVATDAVIALGNNAVDIVEQIIASDAVLPHRYYALDIVESAIVSDTTALQSTLDVAETAAALAIATPVGIHRVDVIESAIATGEFLTTAYENVVELLLATDGYSASVKRVVDIAESARALSAVGSYAEASVIDVVEVLTAADALAMSGIVISRDLADEFFANSAIDSDAAYVPPPAPSYVSGYEVTYSAADAWTANVVNWAMSRYPNFPINGIGGGFATSGLGLFKESDSYADMTLVTGTHDFGSSQLKSMPAMYAYGRHEDSLVYGVWGDIYGADRVYYYDEPNKNADAARATRTLFGKGLKSTYYQVILTSSGYADLTQCVPELVELSRRI